MPTMEEDHSLESQMLRLEKKHKEWMRQTGEETDLGLSELMRAILDLVIEERGDKLKTEIKRLAAARETQAIEAQIRELEAKKMELQKRTKG